MLFCGLKAKQQLSKTCLHVQGGLAAQPSGNSWGQPGSPGSRPGTAGSYRRSEDPPSASKLATFQQTSFNKANSAALTEVNCNLLQPTVCVCVCVCVCVSPVHTVVTLHTGQYTPFLLACGWRQNRLLWKGKKWPARI